MHFPTILFALFLLAAGVAHAADNRIIIMNQDGTTSEFVIPEGERNKPVTVPPEETKAPQTPRVQVQEKRAEPEAEPLAKAPPPEPVQQEAVEEIAAEPVEEITEEAQKTEPAPVTEEAAEEAAEPPKKAAKKEEKKAEAIAKSSYIPIPGRKPQAVEAVYSMPTDTAIPQSVAVSIAIDNAPASSDFKVLRRVHEGIPVYAVVFKTEDGPHVVLIDARNGEVVAK